MPISYNYSETKVFISYAREDSNAAISLYNDLKNAGLQPWLDKQSILPGQRWETHIRMAINSSKYFIPLLSSRSVGKKGYIKNELKAALRILDEVSESQIFVIPVRLDECEIHYKKLRNIQYVDLFPQWDEGLEKVLESMGVNSSKDDNIVNSSCGRGIPSS